MAFGACADQGRFFGTSVPNTCNSSVSRPSLFGDVVVITFLIAQCLDGVFTYVGVATYGLGIEGNPIIASLMAHLGHATALTGAKAIAASLGICLHLRQVHGAVALLTAFYLAAAILPWTAILFF